MVTRTVRAEACDLPALYERMREQRLLKRVVKGDETFEAFAAIHELCGPLCLEIVDDGEVAGFWWVTEFYSTAVCFHACLFKPYRALALEMFRTARNKLFSAGVTDVFVFTEESTPDLVRFCKRAGMTQVTIIAGGIKVWAVAAC